MDSDRIFSLESCPLSKETMTQYLFFLKKLTVSVKKGLTLHLSCRNFIPCRHTGHVNEIDRAVGLTESTHKVQHMVY